MTVIAITGTPGTGKSRLAKQLAKVLKFKRVDLHHYYEKISTGYNRRKQSYDIDFKKFKQLAQDVAKSSNIIIDSHISHLLPNSVVDLCIVLTCSNLKLLQNRLKRRGYSSKKVRENLDTEIFQICLQEAKERGHNVIILDSAKGINFKQLVKDIKTEVNCCH